jgi:hypothetical protein
MREARYVSLIPRTTLHSDSEQVRIKLVLIKTYFVVVNQSTIIDKYYIISFRFSQKIAQRSNVSLLITKIIILCLVSQDNAEEI